MINPYSGISSPQNSARADALYYLDELLRGLTFAGTAFYTTKYIVDGFEDSEDASEFSPALIAGIITGTSILLSMARYYSNKKILKSVEEVWLITWSNFTFLLWAENYVLGQALKWSNANKAIPGVAGDIVFVSLFFTGMFFSINNDATNEFIRDFLPQFIQINASRPRRAIQKIHTVLAKFFEGVGLGNAIVDPFFKLLGPAADGINWFSMLLLGSYKGIKASVPNVVNKIISYPRKLWQRLWHGNYEEIASPAENGSQDPSANVLTPQLAFLSAEDSLGAVLYLTALIRDLVRFKNPQKALPLVLAVLAKALLTPLLENRATYAALYTQLKTSEKENIPEGKPEEKCEKEESTEVDANLLSLFEPEILTTEECKSLKEEKEEAEEKISELTS